MTFAFCRASPHHQMWVDSRQLRVYLLQPLLITFAFSPADLYLKLTHSLSLPLVAEGKTSDHASVFVRPKLSQLCKALDTILISHEVDRVCLLYAGCAASGSGEWFIDDMTLTPARLAEALRDCIVGPRKRAELQLWCPLEGDWKSMKARLATKFESVVVTQPLGGVDESPVDPGMRTPDACSVFDHVTCLMYIVSIRFVHLISRRKIYELVCHSLAL